MTVTVHPQFHWTWKKPGYITMTRKQSNCHLIVGIAATPTSKNPECKNLLENFSPRFFGIKTASSSSIIFQRAEVSTRSVTHFGWCNWRTFWRKNDAGRSPKLYDKCPASMGTCNPEETGRPGLPVSSSPTLFSIFGPVRLPPVPWTKKQLIVRNISSDLELIS
jgi:hypothetical protein